MKSAPFALRKSKRKRVKILRTANSRNYAREWTVSYAVCTEKRFFGKEIRFGPNSNRLSIEDTLTETLTMEGEWKKRVGRNRHFLENRDYAHNPAQGQWAPLSPLEKAVCPVRHSETNPLALAPEP